MSHPHPVGCPDCGNAPINHKVAWFSSVFERIILIPITKPLAWLWHIIEPAVAPFLFKYFLPFFMKVCVVLHIARFIDASDNQSMSRSKVLWEEANRRGIRMREFVLFNLRKESFVVQWHGKTRTFQGLPRPNVVESKGIAWMDDKEIVRERFEAAGIPVSRGGVATTLHHAKEIFKTLRPPVVVKPERGSRSRHTTTHITNDAELSPAFTSSSVLSLWVVIEEEDVGFVYRGTVIGGKLFGVLRREPPLVYGDGIHTIQELIAIENKNPRRDNKIFHKIEIEEHAEKELVRQHKTLLDIPKVHELITFSQKASRGIGGGITDVTDIVHEDIKNMLEHAAKVLHDPLVGIDFIVPDITISWKNQERAGIIECNAMPFIDLHHFTLTGEVRNAASRLWDIVFPDSKL
jgi:cyanophycin synthetase